VASRIVTAVAVGSLVLALVACEPSVPSVAIPSASSPSSEASPATTPAGGVAPSSRGSPCPDSTWPPYEVPPIAGITAVSTDRATVVITNRTNRLVFYRLAAWERAQLETCIGILEMEIQRGPIAGGQTITTTLGPYIDRPDLPVTIAIWDAPCGEGCDLPPVGGMVIDRSTREPVAS